MNNVEKEFNDAIRFICCFESANTTISKEAVNFWLKNHSDTVFVRGKLRQVVFKEITPETYKVKTEPI